MKEVLFSTSSVLLFILISSAIAFNPFTLKAQTELNRSEPPAKIAQVQGVLPPIKITPQVAAQELTLITLPPETGFEALHSDKRMIILNFAFHTTVNDDFSYKTSFHMKKKILKQSARGSGELTFYYAKDRQRIKHIKAHTITSDGTIHPYSKIQDIPISKNRGSYSDTMKKVITLPKVNIGSIIEYSYTLESDHGPVKGAYWDDFSLSTSIPMKEINISYVFSKKIDIRYRTFNLMYEPDIKEGKDTITYSWHLKGLYAEPVTEQYLPYPAIDTIKNAIEFSTIKSWKDVSDWYYKACEKALSITPDIEEAAINATKGAATLKEKVRAILEYIQDNFRYVSMSFGENALEPHPTDEVFKNRYGDCKDLSLLCMAMLKVAGIESDIALFNTEDLLTDPRYDIPIPTMFDHTVVYVHDKERGGFYIDTLLKGYDIGQYPLFYQAAYTFIINNKGGLHKQLPLFDYQRCYTKRVQDITIDEDGSSRIIHNRLWTLDRSIDARRMFKQLTITQKKELIDYLKIQLAPGGEVYLYETEGLEEAKYGTIKSRSEFLIPNAYNIKDGIMVINIAGFSRLDALDKDTREYPIFYPGNYIEESITTYNIPESFEILSVPEDIDLDNGFFKVKRTYEIDKNTIKLHIIEKGTRATLSAEKYPEIKEYYDTLPSKTSQRIILGRS